MEELTEDEYFFVKKTDLDEKIKTSEHLNEQHYLHSESNFWKQVDFGLISQLDKHWAYGIDFRMFGYNIVGIYKPSRESNLKEYTFLM